MFKLLSIGILIYVLYKLVFPAKGINPPDRDSLKNQEDETIDIDYEEVD